jgi:hypothetical protein
MYKIGIDKKMVKKQNIYLFIYNQNFLLAGLNSGGELVNGGRYCYNNNLLVAEKNGGGGGLLLKDGETNKDQQN